MYAHSQMAAPVFLGGVQVMIFGPGMQGTNQPTNVAEVPNGGRGDGPVMPRGSIPPLMENCVIGAGYMHDNFPSDVPEVMVNGAPMAIQEGSPIAGGSWEVHGAPQAPPDSASHDESVSYTHLTLPTIYPV